MEAQFVYENLDFERGRDTKEAIGIGEIALRPEEVKKDIEKILLLDNNGSDDFDPWKTIRSVIVREGELDIECFAGSSVNGYLREILKETEWIKKYLQKIKNMIASPTVERWGSEHDYIYKIDGPAYKYFTPGIYYLDYDNKMQIDKN